MLLKPAPVSTRQFHYDARNRTFTAEVSNLNGFGRVYDDACDEGFTMVSHRTGAEVVFVVVREHRDLRENELLYWELRSTDRKYTAVVFND